MVRIGRQLFKKQRSFRLVAKKNPVALFPCALAPSVLYELLPSFQPAPDNPKHPRHPLKSPPQQSSKR